MATYTGVPAWDMIIEAQRRWLGLVMSPAAGFNWNHPSKTGDLVRFGTASDSVTQDHSEKVMVVGAEVLDITTRLIPGAETKLRRVVREVPVERQVTLHDQTVIIERRPARASQAQDDSDPGIDEREYVMVDLREEAVINKHMELREEVVLRRDITARTQTFKDNLIHTDVVIDQPSRMPMVVPSHTPVSRVDNEKKTRKS